MNLWATLMWSPVRFKAYGPSHCAVLASSLAGALALIALGRARRDLPLHDWLPRVLGAVIVVSEIVFVLYPVPLGYFDISWCLPLQLCDITALFYGSALLIGLPFGMEWGYFLGLSATMLTALTPDLAHDFPHIEFWCFFLTHALVAVVAAYATFGLDRRPRPGAAWKVWLAVNAYGLIAALVNIRLHSNYLYICQKPAAFSPFNFMGDWPQYVVVLDLCLAALLAALSSLAERAPRCVPAVQCAGTTQRSTSGR